MHIPCCIYYQSQLGGRKNRICLCALNQRIQEGELGCICLGYFESSETYCFAIIAWQIMTAKIPFDNAEDLRKISLQVVENDLRPDLSLCTVDNDDRIASLISRCWDPTDRPNMMQVTEELQKIIGN